MSLPAHAPNVVYEGAMQAALAGHLGPGGLNVAYGDLFLADIRAYREALAARLGVTPVFPVWGRDTSRFALDFIGAGFEAIVVSVDLARLDGSLAGRRFDAGFLEDLPPQVDPCGENGEFHTFVVDGPNFSKGLPVSIGAFAECEMHCYREVALTYRPRCQGTQ